MLISHRYRFIFIKTTKTAGTSIEVELSQIMGEDDVVTPIKPPERHHQPRNYKLGMWRECYNHMPASEVKRYVKPKVFESYFKFCVEREPVDKCISHFSMLKNSPHHGAAGDTLCWDEYVEKGSFPLDCEKYLGPKGELLVNRIVRYENLNEELADIAGRLGFQFYGVKARAKSGFRESIHVTQSQRDKIYKAFAPSLAFSGYEPVV